MKTLLTLSLLPLLVLTPLANASTFIDDAPLGFIHIKDHLDSKNENDHYLRTSQIVSVSVVFQEAGFRGQYLVIITTTANKVEKETGEAAGSSSKTYELVFKRKDLAQKVAQNIMHLISLADKEAE
ncbi:MAG: hypothetical protein ACSHXL_02590 [Bacteroidota bacterium]